MVTKTQPYWVQGSWRWRDDSQDLDTTGTYLAAENVAIEVLQTDLSSTLFRLRLGFGESATQTANATFQCRLQYKVGTGSWNNVTTTATGNAVYGGDSSFFSDNATGTLEELTAPTGVTQSRFLYTVGQEDGVDSTGRKPSDQWWVEEWVLIFNGSELSGGETVSFQIIDEAATETVDLYDSPIPTATIESTGAAEDANAVFFGTNF